MSGSVLEPHPDSTGPLELRERKRLVQYAPARKHARVIDLGVGNGYATAHFLDRGCGVVGFGIDIDRPEHHTGMMRLRARGAKLFEGRAENLRSGMYDTFCVGTHIVWCSHVLEHSDLPGLILRGVTRMLSDDGWLCVVVPPYRPWIWHGHMIGGWNLGQLMYLLLMEDFDIKHGHFGATEHNVWGFVQKAKEPLPDGLRMGKGDLALLRDYFPVPVENKMPGDQWNAINWPPPWARGTE